MYSWRGEIYADRRMNSKVEKKVDNKRTKFRNSLLKSKKDEGVSVIKAIPALKAKLE